MVDPFFFMKHRSRYRHHAYVVILYLVTPLYGAFVARHADEFPAIEFYRITVAAQLAVYNGLVLAWREKVTATLVTP